MTLQPKQHTKTKAAKVRAFAFGPSRIDLYDILNQHISSLADKASVMASSCTDAFLQNDYQLADHYARQYDHFCERAEWASRRQSWLVKTWQK